MIRFNGSSLKRLRERNNFSLGRVADEVGISVEYYLSLEQSDEIMEDLLLDLCKFFGASVQFSEE